MILLELRTPMPLYAEEFQRGVLFATAMRSLAETGGGQGVQVLKNEPYKNHPLTEDGEHSEGQYTKKIYHVEKKLPRFIRHIAPWPEGSLKLVEESWNSNSNFCQTIITNPECMKDDFLLKIETVCKDNDRGDTDNALNLTLRQIRKRNVILIDIGEYKHIPRGCHIRPEEHVLDSVTPKRGPLRSGWIETVDDPVMTVYKFVTIKFKWPGLQGTMERWIADKEEELLREFLSQVWCSSRQWISLSMNQIRKLEHQTKKDLKKKIVKKGIKGTMLGE